MAMYLFEIFDRLCAQDPSAPTVHHCLRRQQAEQQSTAGVRLLDAVPMVKVFRRSGGGGFDVGEVSSHESRVTRVETRASWAAHATHLLPRPTFLIHASTWTKARRVDFEGCCGVGC
jgi:hypothetical protein